MRISDWSSDVCSSDLSWGSLLGLNSACRFDEVLGKALQHAACLVNGYIFGCIQAASDGYFNAFAVAAVDNQGQCSQRRACAHDIEGFGAVYIQGDRKSTRLNSSH